MAWSTPLTAVANVALTAAQWNASVRDNLNETAVAKATTGGGFFVATAANNLSQRLTTVATYSGGGTDTTNSTSYTPLTGGASNAAVTGTKALMLSTSRVSHDTAGARAYVSNSISGATTVAASDTQCMLQDAHSVNRVITMTMVYEWTTLTAGTNTFLHEFKVGGNIASFVWRQIMVAPF